jgi:hypothetical protein
LKMNFVRNVVMLNSIDLNFGYILHWNLLSDTVLVNISSISSVLSRFSCSCCRLDVERAKRKLCSSFEEYHFAKLFCWASASVDFETQIYRAISLYWPLLTHDVMH